MFSSTDSPVGLYIHIPFCRVKCHYCQFASFPEHLNEILRTLKALDLEMQNYKGRIVDTLFIGGGTPSLLSLDEWNTLFESLNKNFIFSKNLEATVECNPESSSEEKFALFLKNGINRLSFGLQAVQDSLLAKLGRCHTFDQFKTVYHKALSMGFRNLNIDLIYGIPGQSLADWCETICRVVEFRPKHISIYALSIEENTVFHSEKVEINPELQAEMYEIASDHLQKFGYSHYEISNFSQPGYECKHNLRYWKNLNSIGIGASAASYENGIRKKNFEKLNDYLEAIEQNRSPLIEANSLSEAERIGENLMLSLRLKEGAEIDAETNKLYGDVIRKYCSLGLLNFSSDEKRVFPTRKGWLLSNQIFQELLSPSDHPSKEGTSISQ